MEIGESILHAKRLEDQGEFEESLKVLQEKLDRTLDPMDTWTLLVAFTDICLKNSETSFSAGVYMSSEISLNKGLSLISHKRFTSLKKRLDWKLIRVRLLYKLAEVTKR